jgi:hypothetical protein
LRVVQWATGKVGNRALPAMIEHPEIDLVGLWVHSEDKVGRDAGDIAGTKPTGVIATNDVDELLALKPDCISYMPMNLDQELVERFLRAGVNVVSTCDGFLTGTNFPAGIREGLDAAAKDGGATFMATGFDPGFANLLAGFLTSTSRRVHSVKLSETLDCTTYENPEGWALLGFGQPITDRLVGPLTMPSDSSEPAQPDLPVFFDTLDLIADMMAVEFDHKEAFVEHLAATKDIDLGWLQIPAGTLGGMRRRYVGHAHGREAVELTICWTMTDELDGDWAAFEGYRIEIEGEPRIDATIVYSPPRLEGLSDEKDPMGVLLVGTAMAAVNAIPFVVAAAPGLTTPARLPIFGGRHTLV